MVNFLPGPGGTTIMQPNKGVAAAQEAAARVPTQVEVGQEADDRKLADEAQTAADHGIVGKAQALQARDALAGQGTGAAGNWRASLGSYLETLMPGNTGQQASKAILGMDPEKAQEGAKYALQQVTSFERESNPRGGFNITRMMTGALPGLETLPNPLRHMTNFIAVGHQLETDANQGATQFYQDQSNALKSGAGYQPMATFYKHFNDQYPAEVGIAAGKALSGDPYAEWSKGLIRGDHAATDQIARVLQLAWRTDPAARIMWSDGKMKANAATQPVPAAPAAPPPPRQQSPPQRRPPPQQRRSMPYDPLAAAGGVDASQLQAYPEGSSGPIQEVTVTAKRPAPIASTQGAAKSAGPAYDPLAAAGGVDALPEAPAAAPAPAHPVAGPTNPSSWLPSLTDVGRNIGTGLVNGAVAIANMLPGSDTPIAHMNPNPPPIAPGQSYADYLKANTTFTPAPTPAQQRDRLFDQLFPEYQPTTWGGRRVQDMAAALPVVATDPAAALPILAGQAAAGQAAESLPGHPLIAALAGAAGAAGPAGLAALPSAIPAAGRAVATPFAALARPFTTAGAEATAGRILNEGAAADAAAAAAAPGAVPAPGLVPGAPAAPEASPVPSVPLNTAQLTGNPSVAAMTRQRNAVNDAAAQAERTVQNAALRESFYGANGTEPALSSRLGAADASSVTVDAVRRAADVLRTEENRLWTVPEIANATVDLPAVRTKVADAVNALAPRFRLAIDQTAALKGALGDLGLEVKADSTVGPVEAARGAGGQPTLPGVAGGPRTPYVCRAEGADAAHRLHPATGWHPGSGGRCAGDDRCTEICARRRQPERSPAGRHGAPGLRRGLLSRNDGAARHNGLLDKMGADLKGAPQIRGPRHVGRRHVSPRAGAEPGDRPAGARPRHRPCRHDAPAVPEGRGRRRHCGPSTTPEAPAAATPAPAGRPRLPDDASLADVNSVRSDVLGLQRSLPVDNAFGRKVAGTVAGAIIDAMQDSPSLKGNKPALDAYKAARDYTAAKWDLLGHAPIQSMLAENRFGNTTATEGTAASGLFNLSAGAEKAPGGVRAITDALDDVRNRWTRLGAAGAPGLDPAAAAAARDELTRGTRDFLIAKALDHASSTVLDQTGRPLVIANRLNDWIDTNEGWLKRSGIFEQPQLDLLDRIRTTAQRMARVENLRGGTNSPTFERFKGDKFVDAFMPKLVVRGLGAAIGGTAGYLTEGGIGGMIGLLAGERGAGILNEIYAKPRERVLTALDAALRDPQVATDFMRKATPANAAAASPKTRALLQYMARGAVAGQIASGTPQPPPSQVQ